MSDNTQVTNIMGYVGKDGILKTPLSTVEGKGDKAINAVTTSPVSHVTDLSFLFSFRCIADCLPKQL